MTGTSELKHDDRYYCEVHRRFFPYGRTTCVLCELERKDRLERLVDYFPKGRVKQLMPRKPDRF